MLVSFMLGYPFGKLKKTWGPFVESPGNFLYPKSNIQIEIYRIRARALANKQLRFVSLIDSEIDCYHVRCKTIETSILHVNNNSFTGPLTYRGFWETDPWADKWS